MNKKKILVIDDEKNLGIVLRKIPVVFQKIAETIERLLPP